MWPNCTIEITILLKIAILLFIHRGLIANNEETVTSGLFVLNRTELIKRTFRVI